LFHAHLQPVLEQDDPGLDHDLLESRHHRQEALRLFLRAEAHHSFHAGTVVPAAIEDYDFTRRRQMLHVALRIHLGLLALGWSRQCDDPEHPRAHTLGDRLDGTSLAGAVTALEHDAYLQALVYHPLLQLDELHVQALEFLFIVLPTEFLVGL